jgi:type II secretory pathway component PulF
MPVFAYQGTGVTGEKRTGEIEATSRSEALRKLATNRIQPLSLVAKADMVETKAAKPGRPAASTRPGAKVILTGHIRLTRAQVILFTDELSDFLNSGLQLEPALQLMERREQKSAVKDVSAYLREKVRDGTSFSEALRTASPGFDELYCNLVAAGEASGALAPLLKRQAQHLVAMQELRNRVTLALIYPSVLVLAGIVAVAIFMTVLVPQMTKMFAKTGGAMPLPTFLLIKASDLTHHYGLVALIVVVIGVLLFNLYIHQPAGRRQWDETKLRFPLMGPLLTASFYAQFCQTMANLLQNGLPLLGALKLATGATGNVFYRSLLYRITDLVGEGASLTRAMKSVGHFDANLRDLLKVGEQTGDLGAALDKVGIRYEREIQLKIDRIMSVVPLIIISALGLMVVLIAWSMLSGIFAVMEQLQSNG